MMRRRISILEDGDLLEERECQIVVANGDLEHAIWRGLAYPVFDPDRIEITGPASDPSDGLKHPLGEGEGDRLNDYLALVVGHETAYLLISGSLSIRSSAVKALKALGANILGQGSCLGEPFYESPAEWFVRLLGGVELFQGLEDRLEQAMGLPVQVGSEMSGLRLQLLEIELLEAKARAARMAAELAQVRLARAEAGVARDAADALARETFEREQAAWREALRQQETAEVLAKSRAGGDSFDDQMVSISQKRFEGELVQILETLLPDISLMRDSIEIISRRYRGRRAVYAVLADLDAGSSGFAKEWKKIRGLAGWWERHISTGADTGGRVYVRQAPDSPRYDVLVSLKKYQDLDIEWLRQN